METTHGKPIKDLLKGHRLAAGLTHDDLALRARLSVRTISDIERGLSKAPHGETLQRLANALGLQGTERDQFMSSAANKRRPRGGETLGRSGESTVSLKPNVIYLILPRLANIFWPEVLSELVQQASPTPEYDELGGHLRTRPLTVTVSPVCHDESWTAMRDFLAYVIDHKQQAAGCLVALPRCAPISNNESEYVIAEVEDKLHTLQQDVLGVALLDRPLRYSRPDRSAPVAEVRTSDPELEWSKIRKCFATEAPAPGIPKIGIHDVAAGYYIGRKIKEVFSQEQAGRFPRVACIMEEGEASVELLRIDGVEMALDSASRHLSRCNLDPNKISDLCRRIDVLVCTTSLAAERAFEARGRKRWPIIVSFDAAGKVQELAPGVAYLNYTPQRLAQAAYACWNYLSNGHRWAPERDWAMELKLQGDLDSWGDRAVRNTLRPRPSGG